MACLFESTYAAARDHNDDAERTLPEQQSSGDAAARRAEIQRLLALALDHLDEGSEQIVRDYVGHAIDALHRIQMSDTAHAGSAKRHLEPIAATKSRPLS